MTLIDVDRLHTLGQFLKTARTKLNPDTAGFTGGGRRRTPGLRREEVAQLADVSTTWYTWLEQGRNIQVSALVLDRIATALQLSTADRSYLFTMALKQTSSIFNESPPVIDPTLQRILDYLCPCPAFIADRRCDIIGWNKAASIIFGDIGPFSREDRNIVWLSFMKPEVREMVVNWEDFAKDFLTIFRNYQGQYHGDPWYDEFIQHCGQINPMFKQLWQRSELPAVPKTLREINHPNAGSMRFELTSFQVYARADLRCCVYTPLPDTETEAKLEQLLTAVS
ncbi:helix-turn-helix transcriptional regulator [Paenibacillus radicis (ex Xue et al. 2023)]|uniref:Helix-turn-helix transcriptional regulator n=1 Tax=Paenibacillus radicis (ex Xue et al. 2023) TaxID=2972489 RepID=A0ABT1YLK5_9BACL|nr:helix-turn-helix transcriptional regulator [Paenibacillus radicis (ex Xue et al. 2023)]MCR8634044.1 helix-turn-helix transcriptional regulator [Paenibacillus radicis (ex Xue et al. 2023)]